MDGESLKSRKCRKITIISRKLIHFSSVYFVSVWYDSTGIRVSGEVKAKDSVDRVTEKLTRRQAGYSILAAIIQTMPDR